MKKYEIIKNGMDDYTLKYKDQEINFHSNIDIVTELQKVNKRARLKMVLDLKEQGYTMNDLTQEIKKDGKTYYDNSGKQEIEKAYIEEEQGLVFQEAIEKMFGKTLLQLMQEMELNEKEAEEFSTEVGGILVGQTPRQ